MNRQTRGHNNMVKTLASLFRILVATGIVVVAGMSVALKEEPGTVMASGSLVVTFPTSPLFNLTNWHPGAPVETRTFTVKNNHSQSRAIAIRAANTGGSTGLQEVIWWEVREGGALLHGKTLQQFFADTAGAQAWVLSNVAGHSSKTYTVRATFLSSAGNIYQGKQAKFDLVVGFWQDCPGWVNLAAGKCMPEQVKIPGFVGGQSPALEWAGEGLPRALPKNPRK